MRHRRAALSVILALGCISTAAATCAPASRAVGADESLERGESLWLEHECADCHEHATEPGQTTVLLLRLSTRFDERSLAAFLGSPPRPMPAPELSAEDRRVLARYLLATFR